MTGTINNPKLDFNGKSWSMEYCLLTKWSDTKIIEIHAFFDNAQFEKQVDVPVNL